MTPAPCTQCNPTGNPWDAVERLLARAQAIVDDMMANNSDEYGLLASAKEHIIHARGDIEDDLK